MSRKRACLLSTVQVGGSDVEFWASLKTNSIRKPARGVVKLSVRFLLALTKKTLF